MNIWPKFGAIVFDRGSRGGEAGLGGCFGQGKGGWGAGVMLFASTVAGGAPC